MRGPRSLHTRPGLQSTFPSPTARIDAPLPIPYLLPMPDETAVTPQSRFSHLQYTIKRPFFSFFGRKYYVHAPDGSVVISMPIVPPGSSEADRTAAPAASPKSRQVPRSVKSVARLSVSAPMTSTCLASPAAT